MSVLNSQKVRIHSYNRHLIIALLSIFIAGFILIFVGLILNHEQTSILLEIQIFQIIIVLLIIFGFIFVSLGIIECILIIRKMIRIMDLFFDKVKNPSDLSYKRGSLRIIRPDVSINESQPIEPIKASLKPKNATQKGFNEKPKIKSIDSEDLKSEIVNITVEEALQKIIDRYNDPNVTKMFNNWQNTLMMSFPNLKKNYLFRINNDQGIKLEEGYEEDAAVQVSLDSETFIKMMTKQINPIKAYSSGELEVKGKMKNLLKLRKLMF
jgi:putative sterol carrier protein